MLMQKGGGRVESSFKRFQLAASPFRTHDRPSQWAVTRSYKSIHVLIRVWLVICETSKVSHHLATSVTELICRKNR
eukprot:1144466-Pelagomonas_calceolata.AAC.4